MKKPGGMLGAGSSREKWEYSSLSKSPTQIRPAPTATPSVNFRRYCQATARIQGMLPTLNARIRAAHAVATGDRQPTTIARTGYRTTGMWRQENWKDDTLWYVSLMN